MDRESDHEQRAERERAGGIRRADREALAEVVEPDADRDEQREVGPAGRLARRPTRRASACSVDGGERQVADDRAEIDEQRAAERLRALTATSVPSSSASTIRNSSRPIVNAISTRITVGLERRSSGSQSMPSSTGMTPT